MISIKKDDILNSLRQYGYIGVYYVKNRNVCKFISQIDSDKLITHNFIYETILIDEVNKKKLKHNRMMLVAKGKSVFNFSGKTYDLDTGSLIFGFKDEEFYMENKDCEYMYISFSGPRGDNLFRRFGIKAENRLFKGFESIVPLWQESLTRASEETIDLAAESILLYTFSRLFGSTVKEHALINSVVSISEERFTDPDLSLNVLSEELSYNPKYVSHMFKEKMGITYSEYLRSLRLKFAVSLFDRGLDSVKNVALLSGFSDPLYFSTVFKKHIGLSPKEYKEKNNIK